MSHDSCWAFTKILILGTVIRGNLQTEFRDGRDFSRFIAGMAASIDSDFDYELTGENLRAALDRVGRTQRDLANETGIKYPAINNFIRGDRKSLKAEEERRIRQFLKAAEAGESKPSGGMMDALGRVRPGGDIPLFGADVYDVLRLGAQGRIGLTAEHPAQSSAPRAFAVSVPDDGYAPRLRAGEIAYAVAGLTPRAGQDCVVEMTDGAAVIGEFDSRDERLVTILRAGKKRPVPADNVRAVHAIVGRG